MIKIKKRNVFKEFKPIKAPNSTDPATRWSQKTPSNKGKEAAKV
jgi:hypothetical protein